MTWLFIFIPFLLQGIIMAFDEGYFHLRRGLPVWERIGHPLDTLSVLICLAYALFVPYSPDHLKTFIILSLISCIMVTKDEFVHKHVCPRNEMWLHALLFSLHPLILLSTALIWVYTTSPSPPAWLSIWLKHPDILGAFLLFQFFLVIGFFLYQIVFWNFVWGKRNGIRDQQ
ncbi:MAG: hypothetical protein Tsb0015_01920 [Simkaniaceae bacterium]